MQAYLSTVSAYPSVYLYLASTIYIFLFMSLFLILFLSLYAKKAWLSGEKEREKGTEKET